MSPFDDNVVMDRLFDKLDHIDSKIDDLCERITRQETKYELHIDSEKSKTERKEKTFYVCMAVLGGIISIIEVVRSGVIG